MSLESDFPQLKAVGFEQTSPPDSAYNCIAFAAGNTDRWWEPASDYYWPEGLPRDYTVATLTNLFEGLGYAVCPDGMYESGFEKVVIFEESGEYSHAARLVGRELWASKLGVNCDIQHRLEALEGGIYGNHVKFLKRPAPLSTEHRRT